MFSRNNKIVALLPDVALLKWHLLISINADHFFKIATKEKYAF